MLPVLSMVNLSTLLARKRTLRLSVVPIKLVAAAPALPLSPHAFDVMAGVKSRAVAATPLTVVVKLEPLNEVALLLIISTLLPDTPFTVVDKLFAEDVLL